VNNLYKAICIVC